MFAGIIERVCTVDRVQSGAQSMRLEIRLGPLADGLTPGASVAVNGVCLTLTEQRGGIGAFDVVPETWRLTTLADLRPGDRVNAERALRLGDRIDGHFVQGHVDGVGRVRAVRRAGSEYVLSICPPDELRPYIVRKGSITLDGTSLTIAAVGPGEFSVALIPTTLERTVLAERRPGDRVNIETDILARMIVQRLDALLQAGASPDAARQPSAGLTLDRLRESGFAP